MKILMISFDITALDDDEVDDFTCSLMAQAEDTQAEVIKHTVKTIDEEEGELYDETDIH